ncbi:MAG: hypothetical protein DSM106950_24950 [Stigonema ocellatum SAG 48.90 = DSM 106950]|nr:hypothetical protein [Stigonema ocellatum SAG 48.90 = DSM 106950]
MNEADTPNNGAGVEPLESVNSPQLEEANCPFDSVLPNENITIAKLPLLAPAENVECETEVPEENTPQEDWVAEPDSEQQVIIDSEFKKLLALNEELRSANNDLYNQVENLTVALTEKELALQWQKKRGCVTESMLNQQTAELSAAQEQIQSLYQQLETAVQTVQHQEMFIEKHKAQLEINQQRLAQLERECALIQSNYQEQSHQLLQSENTCRELRTRLMRQQRQTLQFKAALEKCLETPLPNNDFSNGTANSPNNTGNKQPKYCKRANSLSSNTQPIRPWSAQPESLTDDVDNFREESSASPLHPPEDRPTPMKSFIWDTSDREEISTPTQPANTPEIIHDYPTTLEGVSPLGSSNLEEQLDSVIQLFFTSEETASASPQAPTQKYVESEHTDEPLWETFATPVADDTKLENTTITLIEEKDSESEDYWSEPSQLPPLEGSFSDNSANANSPSPLIYPQRPPQGRKSLRSVDLPNFRPKKPK